MNTERYNEIIEYFTNMETLPPAEDDIWYKVLGDVDSSFVGHTDLEREVFNILKSKGYSVRIVGERDSFGWVTRGISVNGTIMCIY